MTSGPLVTMIIASYNHGAYVEQAIRSVLDQSYKNIQLIVIDDASHDDSPRIIQKLQQQNNFTFIQNELNIGLNPTLLRVMGSVEGEYLCTLASDDMILNDKIRRQVDFVQQKNLDGVYSTGFTLHPDGSTEKIDLDFVERMFNANDDSYLRYVYLCHSRGALFQSGLFKTAMMRDLAWVRERFWSDDWAMTIKLLESYKIGFLNEPLFYYRLHESNVHKRYWNTFPGRIQVISQLTPLPLRRRALANLFDSHAGYLLEDHEALLAARFYLSSLVMDFRRDKLWRFLKTFCRRHYFKRAIGRRIHAIFSGKQK